MDYARWAAAATYRGALSLAVSLEPAVSRRPRSVPSAISRVDDRRADGLRDDAGLPALERRIRAQNEAFEAAMDGAPLAESLAILARLVREETAGEARTAFYLADAGGAVLRPVRGAGDMPDAYLDEVDGFEIGFDSLAAGLAVPTGAPVGTAEAADEPRWIPCLAMARTCDDRGCWSFPIKTRQRQAVGMFAMCFREPREATPEELELAETVTRAAAALIANASEAEARGRAETALRESEARYRTLFRAIDEGYALYELLVDAAGNPVDALIHEVNPAYERLTGRQRPAGKRLSEVSPGLDQEWAAAMATVVQTGEPLRFEGHNAAIDRWFDVFIGPVDGPGDPRIVLVLNDITERRRAIARLQASEERRRRIVAVAGVGVLVFDAAGTLVEANDAFLAMTGYTRDDLAARRLTWRRMTPREYHAVSEAQLAQLAATGRFGPYEKEYLRADGARSWLMFAGSALGDGTIVEYCVDIGDRKRAEAALRESEARHAFLLNLTDALRPLGDPDAIKAASSRILGERLGVNRAFYADVDGDDWVITQAYEHDVAFQAAGRHPIAPFGQWILDAFRSGQQLVIRDLHADARFAPAERAIHAACHILGAVAVPLVKDGALVAILVVHSATPRDWSGREIALVEETAERTWAAVERARAEATLRARDAHRGLLVDIAGDLDRLTDEEAIVRAAGAKLAAHLGLAGFHYVDVDEDRAEVTVRYAWHALDVPPVLGTYPISGFVSPHGLERLRAGEPVVIDDVASLPGDDAAIAGLKAGAAAQRIGAYVAVPYSRDGRWKAYFAAANSSPRQWEDAEVELIQEVVGRVMPRVERARTEAALRRSEERLRLVADNVPVQIGFYDRELRYVYVNEGGARFFGAPRTTMVGRSLREFLAPHVFARVRPFLDAALRGERVQFDNREPDKYGPGQDGWTEETYVPIRGDDGAVSGVVSLVIDITTHKRAEAALRESEASLQRRMAEATAELRTLSRRLLQVQEDERRVLARELHDEIGQVLTGLNFQLAAAAGTNGTALAEAQATVQALTEQVRQLSMDLRPAVLDRFGLLPALQWQIDRYQQRTGIQVDLHHAGLDRRFPPALEIGAFRIVQEALTNVARHAHVDRAAVQLFADERALTVVVRDQGQGFDPAQAPMTSGLGGMRERVELLGGTLAIEATPGGGTAVTAELPLVGHTEMPTDTLPKAEAVP